ncbi:hypothetical protein ANO11243_035470 [Dothideomycetidae sp. 11243]|nr:hypothetical protein ANO11243_035470 [fungal sp. No.11243]
MSTKQQQEQDSHSLSYYTLDVFTTTLFAGNQLAVIHVPFSPSTSPVPQEVRQLLAREFNYSETVVLYLPSSSSSLAHNDNIKIFLTDAEIPLAGHPVIGTAAHLFSRILPSSATKAVLRTKAGRCELRRTARGFAAQMPFALHLHRPVFSQAQLVAQQPRLRGVEGVEIDTLSLVKGMTFVYVRLPSLEALGDVMLFGRPLSASVLDEGWNEGVLFMIFYVFLPSEENVVKLRTRMIEGTFEDPATGSASCGLASLLAMKEGLEGDRTKMFEFTQAVEMGRRSDIGVAVGVEGGEIRSLELSGNAVEVMEGKVRWK